VTVQSLACRQVQLFVWFWLLREATAASLSTVDYNLLLSECQNTGNVLLIVVLITLCNTQRVTKDTTSLMYVLKEDTNPLVA